MTRFYVGSTQLNKWMHQNKASYTGMFVEGCLLDSFVLETRRGYAFVYEHYLNANSSDYYVEFVPYKNAHMPEYDKAFADWYVFEKKAESA